MIISRPSYTTTSSAGALATVDVDVPENAVAVTWQTHIDGADDDLAYSRLRMPNTINRPPMQNEGLECFHWAKPVGNSLDYSNTGSCRLNPHCRRMVWEVLSLQDCTVWLDIAFHTENLTDFIGMRTYYTVRNAGTPEYNIFVPVPHNAQVYDVTLALPVAATVPVQNIVEDWYIFPNATFLAMFAGTIGTLGSNVAPQTITQNRYTGRVTPPFFRIRMTPNAGTNTHFVHQFKFWESF